MDKSPTNSELPEQPVSVSAMSGTVLLASLGSEEIDLKGNFRGVFCAQTSLAARRLYLSTRDFEALGSALRSDGCWQALHRLETGGNADRHCSDDLLEAVLTVRTKAAQET